jgi:uncharacterized protein (UPF0210 family)
MKIRSITCFFNPSWPLNESKFQAAGKFLSEAKIAYETAGYEVQTTRLAMTPFPHLLRNDIDETPKLAEVVEALLPSIGVEYAALGPALPGSLRSYQVIPEAIAATESIFFSGVMVDNNGIHPAALRACAEIIVRCAPLDPSGFGNLYFAALANVPPGAPFFPAAYHQGDTPAFAIATEAADLAVDAFSNSKTLDNGRKALVSELEEHGNTLTSVAQKLSHQFETDFGGIDFSLAPFPTDEQSLGGAVEAMGIPKIGLYGSLVAASLLTEAVDHANFPHTGFSGFMQSVLEDSVLAKRAAEGTLTVKDLLLYSAVCGTGLDTIPLPGDVTEDQIAPLLLDLCALALRLDKPLTARLMPIPGKKAGDPTEFDFAFFANSKVMALEAEPLGRNFSGENVLQIQSHGK